MSLINQMLKDIDKRQGVNGTNFSDSEGLRLGVTRQSSALQKALVWGGLFLAAAAAGVYGFRQLSAPAAPVLTQSLPVPAPAEPVAAAASAAPASAAASVETARAAESAPAVAPVAAAESRMLESKAAAAPDVGTVSKSAPARDSGKSAAKAAAVVSAPAPVPATEVLAKPAAKKESPSLAGGTVTRQLSLEQRADNAYREAVSLVRQGRGSDAQKLLQQILVELPAHHDARLLSARVWMNEGQLTEAKALLSEGVALKPQAFQLYSALAQAQLMSKEIDAAAVTLERGLPVAGENAEYHALLAAAMQQQARHSEAVQHYVVALRQLPDTSNWLVGLGVSLQALNNTAGAAEAYQRALDLGLPASLSQFTRDKLNQLKR